MNPGHASGLTEEGLPSSYNLKPDWEFTPAQVSRMREAGEDFLLLDCRTAEENELVRLPDSRLIPLQEVHDHADDLEEDRDRRIVVYCHHGMRSLQMTAILRQAGFTDVKSMAGGIDAWSVAIDPSLPRY